MVFDWLWKRILSEKNLGYAYQKLRPVLIHDMASNLKESLKYLLEDEEVAAWLSDYGDEFVKGRMHTFWSHIGGKQKGLNYALNPQNPLDNLVTEEGSINLAGIIKLVLSGGLKNLGGAGTGYSPPHSSGKRRDLRI